MPSSVRVNGLRIYRPGVYATIDASALGGSDISTGNVALVGEFPSIEQGEPLTFGTPRAVADFHDDPELLLLAKLAFSPSVDDRVPGGAQSLTFVNTKPCTRSKWAFKDENGDESLVLKSDLWGPVGGQTFAKLETNSTDSQGLDVTLTRRGNTETFENLQSGPVCDLWYSGSDVTTTQVSVGPDQWKWGWTKDLTFTAPGGAQEVVWEPTEILSGDQPMSVSLVDGGAGASTEDVTVTFEGLDEAGVPQTETLTAASGGTTFDSDTTATSWGRIDSITIATDDTSYNGTVTVEGTAFLLDTADFSSVGDITSFIDQNANKGFHAEGLHVRINSIPASPDPDTNHGGGGVDEQKNVDALGSGNKVTVRADLWAILEELEGSELVAPERATGAALPPKHVGAAPATSEQTYLVGGSASSASLTDWQDAYQAIEASDIQIVVPLTDDITYLKEAITHVEAAARAGYERNAWVGAASGKTLSELFTDYTSKLNSRYISLIGQEVRVTSPQGKPIWKAPRYLAVMCAGMQAGTSVATPLTWKRPDVLDVRQEWDPNLDAGEAISKGICVLSRDNLGWKVERSVTTHLSDDNPIYSETSAFESVQTSVRDLRAELERKIGTRVQAGTASTMKGLAESRLEEQVAAGFIKAWKELVLEDLGDQISVTYQVAAIEPLNFITITANVVRIPSNT